LEGSWKFLLYLKIFGTSKQELKLKGDQRVTEIIADSIRGSEFVKDAVILAMDAPYDEKGEIDEEALEVYVPNRFVAESVQRHQYLHFGASVHPNRKDALEELEWSKERGAVFVKWLPNIQGIDPSAERYRDYYLKLVELDLPLLTHVGDEDSFSKTDNALGDPKLFPKVLNDERLKGRLMYGTDYPLTKTPLVTALQFPLQLTLKQMWEIVRTRNSWDRDVKLKAALGCPREVFELSRSFLKL